MLTGGILTTFCFFIPWMKLNLPSETGMLLVPKKMGIRTVTGDANVATFAFIAALVILGISIHYMLTQKIPWKFRTATQISCIIGVLCILFTLMQFVQWYRPYTSIVIGTYLAKNPQAEFDLYKIHRIQLGGYGAVIGFILAYIGACNIPNRT